MTGRTEPTPARTPLVTHVINGKCLADNVRDVNALVQFCLSTDRSFTASPDGDGGWAVSVSGEMQPEVPIE